MMKKIILTMSLLLCPVALLAKSRAFGYCEDGNKTVTTASIVSVTKVQQSYPSCTITVYNAGTVTLSTIFSDNIGTPLANPFTANTSGFWFFYAANAHYDVKFSGGGIATPFTHGDYMLFDTADYQAFTNGGNSFGSSPAILGNLDNHDLAFSTNNVERARILASGTIQMKNDFTVSGFSAFGGTTLNNNAGTGYVGIKYDKLFTNIDNEVRGVSSVIRNTRTSADGAWDFFGLTGAVSVEATNTQHITGQMKGVVGELYFVHPSSGSYTVDEAHNFQADIPTLGTNVTVTDWRGLIVNQPPVGGTITNGSAIEIGNLDNGSGTITNPTAMKIGGINNFGRITWPGTNLTDIGGKLQIGSGVDVGAAGSQGVNSGSYAIGGVTLIGTDGTTCPGGPTPCLSTAGYGHVHFLQLDNATAPSSPTAGSTRLYFKTDGTDPVASKKLYYKDSGGNEYTLCTLATCGFTTGITGTLTSGNIPKATAPHVIADSILTDNGAGAMVLTGTNHFDSAGGYYVGGTQIVNNTPSIGNVVNVIGTGYSQFPHYTTSTNCADSAGAAACGSAAAGAFVIDAASGSTVVSTTAVNVASRIFLQVDSSLSTELGVTCNTQSSLVLGTPHVTARTSSTSFTASIDVNPTTNPLCISYFVVN